MKHIAVIGGGFGGIAAALRARAKGFEVTLIDRCPQLGGRAQVFTKNGYKHDAGPTVITAPFLFDELFQLFNKNRKDYIEFKPLDVWYRFRFNDGFEFDYGGTAGDLDQALTKSPTNQASSVVDQSAIKKTLNRIAAISPEDVDGYRKLVQHSKEIYQLGFEELADKPFHQISALLKQAPAMIKLGSYRTVWQFVSGYLKNPYLRQAFSIQPLLVGGNPFDTTSIYNLIHFLELRHGIHFAMGGTGALVQALTQLMQEEGIRIELNATVTSIEIDQNTNQITAIEWQGSDQSCTLPDAPRQHRQEENPNTASSQKMMIDGVISNTDPSYLYKHLIPKKAVNLSAKIKQTLCKKSMGLFVLYFGSRQQYPEVQHHTILMGPRYQELLDDIFNKKQLSDDFSVYLHRPTATDASFAPEGCDSFYALVPVPNLEGQQNWQIEGPKIQNKIIKHLESTLLPGLSQHLDHVFFKTPQDFHFDYLSTAGAGFSIAPLFNQSAWFRYHNQAEGPENLWLTGAGSHPGAGLPGVLSSAKVVQSLLPSANQKEQCHPNSTVIKGINAH